MRFRTQAVAAAASLALLLSWGLGRAEETVDVELILAVDVSGSIDEDEARLQRQGYIDAILNPLVIDAIKSGPHQRIALTYFEWSGDYHQHTVVDWMIIDGEHAAQEFTQALAEAPLTRANRTSISAALDYGQKQFARNAVEGTRKVIDISGDGYNNIGRSVTDARDDALAQGTIIDGLPIINENPNPFGRPGPKDLDEYFRDYVIGGPGSFVVVAHSFADFSNAILNKLIREIAALGAKPPAATD
ncbi:MAG: DUF1194 domain-containing protein [Alphaproteobacteria bacterium]|nr:DUF1194 domain-containing protein [Alphaproteobacteria bacterium]